MSPWSAFLAVVALAVALWLFARWRSPRPEFAPLETKPDDPLLLGAMESARASLPDFQGLLTKPRESALVKLRFVSSTNQVEHLWAEVLEVLGPSELGVRLVTPPVTHRGKLDRLHRCTLDDVEDWQYAMPKAKSTAVLLSAPCSPSRAATESSCQKTSPSWNANTVTLSKTLPWAVLLYAGASLVHFAHNAEYLADYPNLPSWLTRYQIYLVWACISAVGVVGYLLYRGSHRLVGLALLALYSAIGFDGLLHYGRAPMAAHTSAMNLTIWFEVLSAGLLLIVVVALLGKQLKSAH